MDNHTTKKRRLTNRQRAELEARGLKYCPKCGQEQPATLEFFPKSSQTKSGLQGWCKACCAAYRRVNREQINEWHRERYSRNPEHFKAYRKARYVVTREQRLEYNHRYYTEHRTEILEQKKTYSRLNSEKRRASNHNYRARILGAKGEHSREDILAQAKSQNYFCWWCEKRLRRYWHVDHRIPLSKGGSNSAGNICITCPTCNLKKGDKMSWEFNGRLL